MSDLIKEFNLKISNYIEECVKVGEKIDCYEDSYLLTKEKVIAIYNQLTKEKKKERNPQNYKDLLQELKKFYDVQVTHVFQIQELPDSIEDLEKYMVNAIFDYQKSKQDHIY